MKLRLEGTTSDLDVELIAREGDTIRVRAGEREIVAESQLLAGGGVLLTIGSTRFAVAGAKRNSSILVAVGPRNFEFKQAEQGARRRHGGLAAPEITAPMPGKVLKILVKQGDAVSPGQPLVVIEAMKMETTLSAESAAVIGQVRVEPGQMVDHGAVLIELRPRAESA